MKCTRVLLLLVLTSAGALAQSGTDSATQSKIIALEQLWNQDTNPPM